MPDIGFSSWTETWFVICAIPALACCIEVIRMAITKHQRHSCQALSRPLKKPSIKVDRFVITQRPAIVIRGNAPLKIAVRHSRC